MTLRHPSWPTDDGLDLKRLPLDAFIHQAVSEDAGQFASGCRLPGSLASRGRAEAGVSLLGLLAFYRDDLRRLERVAEAPESFPCPPSAEALLGELERLAWFNAIRRYLDTVLDTLMRFPATLVVDGSRALASDPLRAASARRRCRDIADHLSGSQPRGGV